MRFVVKVGNDIVGFSELEGGDPPMGVAGGKFLPTEAYRASNSTATLKRCNQFRITVELEGGQPIEHSGPVQVIDFGPELGEEGIQIYVDGIPYPLYGELFPHHVAVYENQFK